MPPRPPSGRWLLLMLRIIATLRGLTPRSPLPHRRPSSGRLSWALGLVLTSFAACPFPESVAQDLSPSSDTTQIPVTSPTRSSESGVDENVELDGGRHVVRLSVAELVERLGSPSYTTRQRAVQQLKRMGLAAFDDLRKAQGHPDIEVAITVSKLINSLDVRWGKETDPPQAREALESYGAQNENERLNRITRLAALPRHQGFDGLVRLARFEPRERLSAKAALAIMRQPISQDPAVLRKHVESIREQLANSNRMACVWLKTFAADLSAGDYQHSRWQILITQLRDEIDRGVKPDTGSDLLLELVRICAVRASRSGQADSGLELAASHMDLIEPSSRSLIDAASWAIDNDLPAFILRMRQRFVRQFDGNQFLLYFTAEALQQTGKPDEANLVATQAFEINPIPPRGEKRESLSPGALDEMANSHAEVAQELEKRGWFPWAQREWKHVIDSLDIDSVASASARGRLAMSYGLRLMHQDVVDLLGPFVDRVRKDDEFRSRCLNRHINVPSIESEYARHLALMSQKRGDVEAAKQQFESALSSYPLNIDILIEMYRLTDSDETWKSQTQRRIAQRLIAYENRINPQDRRLQFARGNDGGIANQLNEYAWLVSNTEGDFAKALEYSRRSLELSPGSSAYLDTCARCYYVNQELQKAIDTQKQALQLDPHSPPMLRQLEEFEAALAAASS
ncbi:MAG: hypothetical protein AAGA03_15005 [Planctomycetota bacterium]